MTDGNPGRLPTGNAASMKRPGPAGGFRLLMPNAGSPGVTPA